MGRPIQNQKPVKNVPIQEGMIFCFNTNCGTDTGPFKKYLLAFTINGEGEHDIDLYQSFYLCKDCLVLYPDIEIAPSDDISDCYFSIEDLHLSQNTQ
jgi:hypothetical protein